VASVEDLTVDVIAKALGIGRASIYQVLCPEAAQTYVFWL
jgi:hypothetical protein